MTELVIVIAALIVAFWGRGVIIDFRQYLLKKKYKKSVEKIKRIKHEVRSTDIDTLIADENSYWQSHRKNRDE